MHTATLGTPEVNSGTCQFVDVLACFSLLLRILSLLLGLAAVAAVLTFVARIASAIDTHPPFTPAPCSVGVAVLAAVTVC